MNCESVCIFGGIFALLRPIAIFRVIDIGTPNDMQTF